MTKTNRGTLLIDVVLALSLGLIFITIITESSVFSRIIFEKAKDKNILLDTYELDKSFMGWYGNNFIETDYGNASSSINFIGVKFAKNSDSNRNLNSDGLVVSLPIGGPAICSVNFANPKLLGSYEYFNSNNLVNNSFFFASSTIQIIPIHLPIDPTLPLTDLEVRNSIVYVSVDSAVSADPDIIIFDINDPNNPRQLSNLNTGPGLTAITLVGKRIFGSAPSTVAQLHIIRIDGLEHPVLENLYRLALPYATATPALGSAITYDNNKVFLGTEKWEGDEFNVIDVLNPLSPTKVGSLEIGSKVIDILINENNAYLATASHDQLEVVDLTRMRVTITQTFSPSGWQRQEGKVSSFFEQHLDFGRTSGGFDLPNDHEIFSWATTSTTTLQNYSSTNILGGVYGIVRDRFAIYLATRQLDKEFQIFIQDLSTSSISYSLPIAPQTMTCDGDSIYILANKAPFIFKINFI